MSQEVEIRLTVSRLTRVVGRRHILRKVSFVAREGELIALVGRNGAGKTTLLSLIAGRNRPDGGEITLVVGGNPVTGKEHGAETAFLPHDLFIYPDLTARENLAFFASLHGAGNPARRATEALDRVGLTGDADRVVRTFSRGMQQRVAVGRLFSSNSRIWFLDEPATGLDSPGRKWLQATLAAHVGKGGLIFMASHSQEEVAAVASRVLVIEAGRLVLDELGGAEGAMKAFRRMEGGAR